MSKSLSKVIGKILQKISIMGSLGLLFLLGSVLRLILVIEIELRRHRYSLTDNNIVGKVTRAVLPNLCYFDLLSDHWSYMCDSHVMYLVRIII